LELYYEAPGESHGGYVYRDETAADWAELAPLSVSVFPAISNRKMSVAMVAPVNMAERIMNGENILSYISHAPNRFAV